MIFLANKEMSNEIERDQKSMREIKIIFVKFKLFSSSILKNLRKLEF